MNDLHILSIIFSAISILFEIIVLVIILFHKAHKKFRFEIVTYINLACLGYNISYLLPETINDNLSESDTNANNSICALQSFFLPFFESMILCLTSFLSYSVNITSIKVDYLEQNKDFYRWFCIIGSYVLSLPIPLSIILTKSYGNSNGWCFLDILSNNYIVKRVTMIYYTLNICLLLACCILTIKIFHFFYIKKSKKSKDPILLEKYNLMKWFPVYYILSRIPSIINRLYQVFGKKDMFVFQIVQVISEQSIGFVLFSLIVLSPPFSFIFYSYYRKKFTCFYKNNNILNDNDEKDDVNCNITKSLLKNNTKYTKITNVSSNLISKLTNDRSDELVFWDPDYNNEDFEKIRKNSIQQSINTKDNIN